MDTRSIRTLKLVGGWLCLDFANTLGMHASDQTQEFLRSYFDLAEWSQYSGIIDDDEERRLLLKAEKNPIEAEKAHQLAKELREIIFQIFSSIARKTSPHKKELDKFNQKLSQMMRHSKFKFPKSGVVWDVKRREDSLDGMLNSIIQSAFMLLISNELDRVKICADERGCGWLFFDQSKNSSRQWCDMKDCGNLAKQRRYYGRRHKFETK
jgi:predicted RNA-binding Zn ribbon-like protein